MLSLEVFVLHVWPCLKPCVCICAQLSSRVCLACNNALSLMVCVYVCEQVSSLRHTEQLARELNEVRSWYIVDSWNDQTRSSMYTEHFHQLCVVHLSSSRQHLSCDVRLVVKRKYYRNCFVLCFAQWHAHSCEHFLTFKFEISFLVLTKRLAGKRVSSLTYFVSMERKTLSQSVLTSLITLVTWVSP